MPTDVISVSGLTYRYPGAAMPSVHGLDFTVAEGEIFGFLGPSGAGKSTTQKILTGLLPGAGGTARALGRDLTALGRDYFEEIGVCFETPNLYLKLTARENLEAFGRLYRGPLEDPDALLERVGLGSDAGTRAGEMSKGMRTRLGFARAFLHRPRLLFLDEPTSGLDPVNAEIAKDMVREARDRGASVFLTTHDMNVADQLCDRVAFMVDGRIAAVDTPRALKREHGVREVAVEWREGAELIRRNFPLDGLGQNRAFLDLVARVPLETIHSQETTLEKVFIDVTGSTLA